MKTIKNILSLFLITIVIISCKNEAKQPEVKTVDNTPVIEKTIDPNATYAKAEFTIEGMTCEIGCAATIQKKLGKMEGVKSAKVDFEQQLAMVEYNEAKVTPASLETTVTNIADIYKVKDMKTVKAFSAEKKSCETACEKECCKTVDKKMVCLPDCKAACCSEKKAA